LPSLSFISSKYCCVAWHFFHLPFPPPPSSSFLCCCHRHHRLIDIFLCLHGLSNR
jgi:hypothetical protein